MGSRSGFDHRGSGDIFREHAVLSTFDSGSSRDFDIGPLADLAALMGSIICACYAVGRDALVRAIADQEVTTVQEIGQLLAAGTNCGSCIPELNGLFAEHRPTGNSAGVAAAVAG